MISYDLSDGVASLTLDDGKANALGFDMIETYRSHLAKAQSEADLIVIRGRPGVMSAGFDLKVMKTEPHRVADMVRMGAELLVETLMCPTPVIMASTGHAMAAGGLLMLTADIRLGMQGEFFYGLNETAIGMVMPDFGLELARYRLGETALDEAVLNAQLYSPSAAQQIGYLDHVASSELFEQTLSDLIEKTQKLDLKAYRGTKKKLRYDLGQSILASLDADNLNIAG